MRRRTTAEWAAVSFGVALAIVLVVRMAAPPGDKLGVALRATARWSFVLFWLASAGSALTTLFGSTFKTLAERARDFGLAFASAHLVHLSLVVWLYYFFTGPPRSSLIVFGIAVFWTYLLALLSVRRFSALLTMRIARILRTVGIEYIAFVFLIDFMKNPFQGGVLDLLAYLPFQALAIAGPLLRLAAVAKRLGLTRRPATS